MHSGINNSSINRQINIPSNVNVEKINNLYIFKGPNGTINCETPEKIIINIQNNIITIQSLITKKDKKNKKYALINTICAIFKNHIKGVVDLFEKSVIIKGIGYKAEYKDLTLKLFLGYSHPVTYKIPEDIKIELLTQTSISIKGISKHKVGQIADEIRRKKPADSYKGNGIKYKNDTTKLKSPKKTK